MNEDIDLNRIQLTGHICAAIDYRMNWISNVFSALESAFLSIDDMADYRPIDAIDIAEYAEEVFGVIFVQSQSYMNAIAQDVNKIRIDEGKSRMRKNLFYSDYDEFTASSTISPIQTIDTAANYYKHHHEWSQKWEVNKSNKLTISSLWSLNIHSDTEFPCIVVAEHLFGSESQIVSNFEKLLRNWRISVINSYTSETTG